MRRKRFRLYLIILTVVVVLLALFAESVYFSDFEYRIRTKKFNKILADKETVTENCLNSLKLILDKGEDMGSITRNKLFSVIESQGITLLAYVDNKLVHWSDNSFDVSRVYEDSLFAKPLVFLQNGWFITKSVQSSSGRIIALLRVRNDFGFENDLVRNGFVSAFDVPENTGISFDSKSSKFKVFNNEGKWLFSLVYPEVKEPSYFIIGPVTLWCFAFILIMLLAFELVNYLAAMHRNYLAVCSGLVIFILIYCIVLVAGRPAVFF
jgi:hypothetical protein